MRELHFRMYERRVPVLAVFEGWDAAGKGGAIKRVTATLEPRGFTVSSFSVPRGEEKSHHYLWRFWRALPRTGHLGIFDRSYYGRVLVERVEGFCSEDGVAARLPGDQRVRGAPGLDRHGDPEVLAARLAGGAAAPLPRPRARSVPRRTSSPRRTGGTARAGRSTRPRWRRCWSARPPPIAPWTVVEADDKLYARVKVLKTLADAVEEALGGTDADAR